MVVVDMVIWRVGLGDLDWVEGSGLGGITK